MEEKVIRERVEELTESGINTEEAREIAFEEFARDFGTEGKRVSKKEQEETVRKVIQVTGGSTTVLGSNVVSRSYYPFEMHVIASNFKDAEEYEQARKGNKEVIFYTIQGGANGGHPSGTIHFNRERFENLESAADELYRSQSFNGTERASNIYTILTEAGVSEESLDKPTKKLPPGHPDSADHFQYQMQSLEGPEDRRPPRR